MSPETQKASKPLATGGPHWVSLHRSPGPVADLPPNPGTPALRSSGFQLQPLGPKQLRAPKLLLNQGPSELCYATWLDRSTRLAASNCGRSLRQTLLPYRTQQGTPTRRHQTSAAVLPLQDHTAYSRSVYMPGARFTKYLTTILRLSYDNAEVTFDLRRTSNLQNILPRTQ